MLQLVKGNKLLRYSESLGALRNTTKKMTQLINTNNER